MSSIDDSLRPGTRRWIAWKLVQLAHRIYDATFYERITVAGPDGPEIEIDIAADMYGGGVMSSYGHDRFGDYQLTWDEFTPEWLNDEEEA